MSWLLLTLKLDVCASNVQILVVSYSVFSAIRNTAALYHLLEGENEVTIDGRLAELPNNVQYICDPPRPRLSCVANCYA